MTRPIGGQAADDSVDGGLADCENCLRADRELVGVRRSYLVPEAWDGPGRASTVDEVEQWCPSCRVTYPHEVAGDPPG